MAYRYTTYFEANGKYFKRDMMWWDKEGYYRPMKAVRISRREYRRATESK